jgi:hypothetical protein
MAEKTAHQLGSMEVCMKLNPHSWHARWVLFWADKEDGGKELPSDICSYARSLLKAAFFTGFASFMIVGFLVAIFYGAPLFIWTFWPSSLIPLSFIALVIIWIFVKDWELVREFINAHKEKYCQRIEWESPPDA